MKRALVTGGAGFIGSYVVERFLKAGFAVEVLDDLSTGRREHVPPGVPLHEIDVASRDAGRLVCEGRFDLVAHLAAQMDVRVSVDDPLRDSNTNIGGILTLLEGVRSYPADRRPKMVFASTGGALYGDDVPTPTAENAFPNPDSPYGVAKLSSELYLAYYARVWGLQHAALRFGNVYGPRQNPDGEAGVIAIFAKRLLAGQPLTVYGDGKQTRDYVDVTDVAEAFFVAATAAALPAAGALHARAFNVGTRVETSVLDLVRMLSAAVGVEPTINLAPVRPGELRRSCLDPRKADRVLGWRSRVSLEQGLPRVVEWIRHKA